MEHPHFPDLSLDFPGDEPVKTLNPIGGVVAGGPLEGAKVPPGNFILCMKNTKHQLCFQNGMESEREPELKPMLGFNKGRGAGEMAQQLKEFAALGEDNRLHSQDSHAGAQ